MRRAALRGVMQLSGRWSAVWALFRPSSPRWVTSPGSWNDLMLEGIDGESGEKHQAQAEQPQRRLDHGIDPDKGRRDVRETTGGIKIAWSRHAGGSRSTMWPVGEWLMSGKAMT